MATQKTDNRKWMVTAENWVVTVCLTNVQKLLALALATTGDGQFHFRLMEAYNNHMENFRNECHYLAYKHGVGIRKVSDIANGIMVFGQHEHGIAYTTLKLPMLLSYAHDVKVAGDAAINDMIRTLRRKINTKAVEAIDDFEDIVNTNLFTTNLMISWGNIYDMYLTGRTTGPVVDDSLADITTVFDDDEALDHILIKKCPWSLDIVGEYLDQHGETTDSDYYLVPVDFLTSLSDLLIEDCREYAHKEVSKTLTDTYDYLKKDDNHKDDE